MINTERLKQAGWLNYCWNRDLKYEDLDRFCLEDGVVTPDYAEWMRYCTYWDDKMTSELRMHARE